MNSLSIFQSLVNEYAGYTFLVGFLLVIGSLGAARLFAKANQPWVAAFIPVWNVAIVLKMVGRPVSHLAFFLVPFYNVYFFFRLCVERAQSFGKYSILDYVLVSVFNVFYVLNLALAYNEEYEGPVYGVDRAHHGDSNVLAAH
jgi:signal peptidase I